VARGSRASFTDRANLRATFIHHEFIQAQTSDFAVQCEPEPFGQKSPKHHCQSLPVRGSLGSRIDIVFILIEPARTAHLVQL